MYTRRVIHPRRMVLAKEFAVLPFTLPDIGLSSFILVAVIAVWYVGDFHAFHHSDTAIFTLSSLYRWTPFAWEYDHLGSLLPLLASVIHRPYANLLVLSALNSFAFLGGLVLWASLISLHQARLVENSLWLTLLIPLVMPKIKLFENAAYNYPWGLGFFFAGLFTYGLQRYLKRKQAADIAVVVPVLLALAFLTVYVSKISLIPLLIVTPALLWGNLKSNTWPVKPARRTFLFYFAPVACLGLALLIYQILEARSEFQSALTLNPAFMPLTLPPLLKNWASQELTTPLLLIVALPALFYHLRTGPKQNPLFIYLAFGVAGEALIISSSIRTVRNLFTGIYLTDLTFLLLLLLSLTLSTFVQRIESAIARWSVFAIVILLAIYLNIHEWNSFSPASPFAVMERTIGANSRALVEAKCDILAGGYWRVWPAVLAVNDYYDRNSIRDPRTGQTQLIAGIAYRAWPTESLWQPRLNFPDLKLCAFADDGAGLHEALGAYTPELALRVTPVKQLANVVVYELNDNHYSSLQLNFDFSVPGTGWGSPEVNSAGETFVWMTAAQSELILPLETTRDLSVEFRAIYAMAPDITQSLTLTANDQLISLTSRIDEAGGALIRGLIPKSTLALAPDRTRFAFRVNRTLTPVFALPNSLDTRPLALALDWFRVGPVEQ